MRVLIVEDDYITSQVLQEILLGFGRCDIAQNGRIGLDSFTRAIESNDKYEAIFLDIMMPEMDGQNALLEIRNYEDMIGVKGLDRVKIIMTTALDDYNNVKVSFDNQCEGYLVKPVHRDKVIKILSDLNLI